MNKADPENFGASGLDTAAIVDLCGLEAPEPMERILLACTRLGPEDHYLARLPHVPTPLFPHLESRGLSWHLHGENDGSVLILIRRAN